MDRGRKFKSERYLMSNDVFTSSTAGSFIVKGKCKASMKKEMRNMKVYISRFNGLVKKAHCTCPAGNSGFCNHIMALLFELAEYSLQQFDLVPEEIACTSGSRQWGIPKGQKDDKKPVMKTALKKTEEKRGLQTTLYDPRRYLNDSDLVTEKVNDFKHSIMSTDNTIGFADVIPRQFGFSATSSGEFPVGSPLSYQLKDKKVDFEFITNIEINNTNAQQDKSQIPPLPLGFYDQNDNIIPQEMNYLDQPMRQFLLKLKLSTVECRKLECDTIRQSDNPLWHEARESRLTSSTAHTVFIRKQNFQSLANQFTNPKQTSKFTQVFFDYGHEKEPIARNQYFDILTNKLNRNIQIKETGICVQPNLFWLAASPDGLVVDEDAEFLYGLIEIKCPKSKQNLTPTECIESDNFYVGMNEDKPLLKKDHSTGYYSQIQMAMGICKAQYCDFVVYTSKGMIIVRTGFDAEYFGKLVEKLSSFYIKYYLPEIIQKHTQTKI